MEVPFKTNFSGEKINENQCRKLCIPRFVLFCYVIVISPPSSKPVYGMVVLPVAPLPTNLDSTAFFFSRAQKRALESTELAYRRKRTSFLFLILLLLYFYILLGYLLPSTCHPTKHCSKRPRTLKICALIKIK